MTTRLSKLRRRFLLTREVDLSESDYAALLDVAGAVHRHGTMPDDVRAALAPLVKEGD